MIAYWNGQFIPKESIHVSPDDRGFLLSDGAYEVIRSYRGKLFKVQAHLKRFDRSLRELRITGLDTAALEDVAAELILRNNLITSEATVYLQVTRGAGPRRHAFPDKDTPLTVYACPAPVKSLQQKQENGVGAILVPDIRWERCDIKAIGLLPNVLANQQAQERGAEEAIFVRSGVITEGSHSNVCAVIDGQVVTHPRTNHILAGITRQTMLELCVSLGIPVEETPILHSQLDKAQEFILLNTSGEVTPIVQIENRQVGDGKPGPVTRRLQKAFRELTG